MRQETFLWTVTEVANEERAPLVLDSTRSPYRSCRWLWAGLVQSVVFFLCVGRRLGTYSLGWYRFLCAQCVFSCSFFSRLQNDPPSGVTGAPMDTNIMLWQAVIFGPDDTPWEGGTFKLVLEFTEDYPNKAPQVRFLTKMFHPNIYNDGQICLDILQNQWSPIYDISAILTSIQSLLCDPNPSSPANSEASRLYNENRREYNRRVREIVEQSWIDES